MRRAAAAYGVDEFLFVYGDRPETGSRSDDLTVRSMIDEARRFAAEPGLSQGSLRIGVTSRLGTLPSWKRDADFLFVQVSFSVPALLACAAYLLIRRRGRSATKRPSNCRPVPGN